MTENPPSLQCEISASTKILIRGVDSTADLENAIYAINWFHCKRPWLYALYTSIAGKIARANGAQAIFKGHLTDTLPKNGTNERDTLLIVRYPSGHDFKNLVENKVFQLSSLLRNKALQKFSFGFSKKHQLMEKPLDGNSHYLLQYFGVVPESAAFWDKVANMAASHSVGVFYTGDIQANLVVQKDDEKKVPCVMDSLVVFEASGKGVLEEFVQSDEYQALLGKMEVLFTGFLQREV